MQKMQTIELITEDQIKNLPLYVLLKIGKIFNPLIPAIKYYENENCKEYYCNHEALQDAIVKLYNDSPIRQKQQITNFINEINRKKKLK